MRLHVIQTDPQHLSVDLPERENIVAEFAGLGRAAGRVVLRIKIEHYPLITVVFERVQLPVLVRQFEPGRILANRNFLGACRAK